MQNNFWLLKWVSVLSGLIFKNMKKTSFSLFECRTDHENGLSIMYLNGYLTTIEKQSNKFIPLYHQVPTVQRRFRSLILPPFWGAPQWPMWKFERKQPLWAFRGLSHLGKLAIEIQDPSWNCLHCWLHFFPDFLCKIWTTFSSLVGYFLSYLLLL